MIRLYTPILPIRSGTANFGSLVVKAIAAHFPYPDRVEIVIDTRTIEPFVPGGRVPTHVHGIMVRDYREIPAISAADELRCYFLANNPFHAFVYHTLSLAGRASQGHSIGLVHEPSCSMLSEELAKDGAYTFDQVQYMDALEIQYGRKAQKFFDDKRAGNLPAGFDYSTIGFASYALQCTEVWCQSSYSMLKLLLETRVTEEHLPVLQLTSHPLYHEDSESRILPSEIIKSKTPDVFRVGAFGWMSDSKRILQLIRAFGLFLDRLTPEQGRHVELVLVGKLPPADDLDVAGEIRKLDLQDNVELFDFVSDAIFARLVRTCDIISNLRFPSCGETSGTLAHGHESGARVIVSSYQAFASEISDFRVPIILGFEEIAVSNILARAYAEWATAHRVSAASSQYERKISLTEPVATDKYLLYRCFEHMLKYY